MRLFITVLSMTSLIAFGYALAGYAGYALGHGRRDYVVLGLFLGTLTGVLALWLWKRWMPLFLEDVLPEEGEAEQTLSCLPDLIETNTQKE